MIQPIRMNNCSHLNLLQKLIEGTRWRHQYVINDMVTSSLRRWWRHLYSRVNIFPKHTYIHIIYPDFWLVESQPSEPPHWWISESWFSEVKFWNSGIFWAENAFPPLDGAREQRHENPREPDWVIYHDSLNMTHFWIGTNLIRIGFWT